MKTCILDCETNALENPTECHVVVCRDLETNDVRIFRHIHRDLYRQNLKNHLSTFGTLVGHNLIGFDLGVLDTFLGVSLRDSHTLLDTLIVSRLLNYNRPGGHSLESWGEFFGTPKSTFSDYTKWSKELEERCILDTLLTSTLYKYLKRYIESPVWSKSIELEHSTAILCNTLHSNGFYYDIEKGKELEKELEDTTRTLKDSFSVIFPPKTKLLREITPSVTQKGVLKTKDFRWLEGNDLTPYSPGSPFSLFTFEEFNPNSPKQIVERLNQAGWKPFNKTKGHIEAERLKDEEKLKDYRITGWKVDEENLSTLPEDAPEATRKLAQYILLNSRLGDLREWNGLYNPLSRRIHGTFNGMGAWTHRKSHTKPNMANIPSLSTRNGKPQPYGKEFRSLWTVPNGKILVGCDAEGIQLRLFAHYCNDKRLIESIVSGKKEDKTDIHSLNMAVLHPICNSRDVAKTYIYALLLGAGKAKQASILGCSLKAAEEGLERILEYYPGWQQLKDGPLKHDGNRGYFEGLDGRLVMVPDTHKVLAGYLQNGESVVMKLACLRWTRELQSLNIPFKFVNDVHDEWQTEADPEYAETIGRVQTEAIQAIGSELGLNCPLAGKYVIGNNWAETH